MKSLIAYMKRSKRTQRDLAESIGVSQPVVCRYLSGDKRPSIDTLVRLSAEISVPLDKLLREVAK